MNGATGDGLDLEVCWVLLLLSVERGADSYGHWILINVFRWVFGFVLNCCERVCSRLVEMVIVL